MTQPRGLASIASSILGQARSAERRVPWWFLAPALLVYVLVIAYPMLSGVGYAFTNWNGLDPNFKWVGLSNFKRLLSDPQAVSAVKMTFFFALCLAILQNSLGLLLALALNTRLKSRGLLRLFFFMPVVLTPLIISYLWKYILSTLGPLNQILELIGLAQWQQGWLGSPGTAMFSVLLAATWQSLGLSMVIYLAGLQSIPAELTEACRLDGANRWQVFRFITFPMLAPALTVTVINSLITSLKLFDQIYVLTGGGPGYATETLSTLIYKTAFTFAETGYGSAISVVFSALVSLVVLSTLQLLRKRELEYG